MRMSKVFLAHLTLALSFRREVLKSDWKLVKKKFCLKRRFLGTCEKMFSALKFLKVLS